MKPKHRNNMRRKVRALWRDPGYRASQTAALTAAAQKRNPTRQAELATPDGQAQWSEVQQKGRAVRAAQADETLARVLELDAAGRVPAEIAAELDLYGPYVAVRLNRAGRGVKARKQAADEALMMRAGELQDAGMSVTDIAATLEMTYRQAWRLLERARRAGLAAETVSHNAVATQREHARRADARRAYWASPKGEAHRARTRPQTEAKIVAAARMWNEGATYREIGAALNLSQGSVSELMRQAREQGLLDALTPAAKAQRKTRKGARISAAKCQARAALDPRQGALEL